MIFGNPRKTRQLAVSEFAQRRCLCRETCFEARSSAFVRDACWEYALGLAERPSQTAAAIGQQEKSFTPPDSRGTNPV
jgi:hypothetical protein